MPLPPFLPNSFVHRAILRVDEAGTRAASVGAPPVFPAQRFRSWGYTVGERGRLNEDYFFLKKSFAVSLFGTVDVVYWGKMRLVLGMI